MFAEEITVGVDLDDEEFDPAVTAMLRYIGMGDDELFREIEIAKALLKREGYIVL